MASWHTASVRFFQFSAKSGLSAIGQQPIMNARPDLFAKRCFDRGIASPIGDSCRRRIAHGRIHLVAPDGSDGGFANVFCWRISSGMEYWMGRSMSAATLLARK
jgi:hypothetical protein